MLIDNIGVSSDMYMVADYALVCMRQRYNMVVMQFSVSVILSFCMSVTPFPQRSL